MKFLFAFFAEDATMDMERQTVNVSNGGPNTLVMRTIPGVPEHGAIVWAIESEPAAANQRHIMSADLVDADGKELFHFRAQMFQGADRFESYRPVQTFMAMPIAGHVTIPAPGDYGFRFYVDDVLVGSMSLYIRRPDQVGIE